MCVAGQFLCVWFNGLGPTFGEQAVFLCTTPCPSTSVETPSYPVSGQRPVFGHELESSRHHHRTQGTSKHYLCIGQALKFYLVMLFYDASVLRLRVRGARRLFD